MSNNNYIYISDQSSTDSIYSNYDDPKYCLGFYMYWCKQIHGHTIDSTYYIKNHLMLQYEISLIEYYNDDLSWITNSYIQAKNKLDSNPIGNENSENSENSENIENSTIYKHIVKNSTLSGNNIIRILLVTQLYGQELVVCDKTFWFKMFQRKCRDYVHSCV